MTVYALRTRTPEQNYFADIRFPNGATQWVHLRTNLGRKIAYAIIAKHYAGEARIVALRDENTMNAHDREGLDQGSDGNLITNMWAGYSTYGESYASAR